MFPLSARGASGCRCPTTYSLPPASRSDASHARASRRPGDRVDQLRPWGPRRPAYHPPPGRLHGTTVSDEVGLHEPHPLRPGSALSSSKLASPSVTTLPRSPPPVDHTKPSRREAATCEAARSVSGLHGGWAAERLDGSPARRLGVSEAARWGR
eukprot:760235-Prymnesium_polylepis.2